MPFRLFCKHNACTFAGRSRRFREPGLLAAMMLLTGCSHVADRGDYRQPVLQETAGIEHWQRASESDTPTTVSAIGDAQGAAVASLPELLPDERLRRLINKALAANPGVQQTLFTLQQARSQAGIQGAGRWPTVDASVSGERQQDSGNRFSSSLNVSWQLDLWAQLADQQSASLEEVAAGLASYDSARATLVANVMDGWLQLIRLQQDIATQQRLLSTLQKNEQAILDRYRAGIGSLDDLDSARTSLANARATQAANRYDLAVAQRNLTTLSGSLSRESNNGEPSVESPDYPEVLYPLADLSSSSLARRPDLLTAWHNLKAAELRVDIAYKDMLPGINLTASLSDGGASPAAALMDDPVWSLLGQLTAPLFRAGALEAAAESAEFAAAQAAARYREVLLTAVQEVDNALDRERSLAQQIHHVEQALTTARSNEERYLSRYRSGIATLLELLNVQQSRYNLEQQLNGLNYQRLSNRITLGLALGLPASHDTGDDAGHGAGNGASHPADSSAGQRPNSLQQELTEQTPG